VKILSYYCTASPMVVCLCGREAELALTAKVGRVLRLCHSDRRSPNPNSWISEIPADFDGVVTLDPPEHVVEIQLVKMRRHHCLSMSMDSCQMGRSVFVPLKNEVRIRPQREPLERFRRPLLKLSDVIRNYAISEFPLIVRIVNWSEVSVTKVNGVLGQGRLRVTHKASEWSLDSFCVYCQLSHYVLKCSSAAVSYSRC